MDNTYEQEKDLIKALNLPAEEYEQKIKDLVNKLGY